MRRLTIYGSVFVAATIAAVVMYHLATRKIVIERPMLGERPPQAPAPEILIGRSLPTFAAVDQNGRPAGTEALVGRVVVINMFATWCRPCKEELPRLEREVWRRFEPQVSVVALALGEGAGSVREFNRRTNLTFALVADPNGDIARRFSRDNMIPRTYVISRSGVIVYQTIGYDETSFSKLVSAVQHAIEKR
ncbi:MAG TPA: TlpA disulfide reductase family protein [Thermoanaerobaculia bacterium]|jgi:peroxiredoxin|nr:TlpA disulfide reductase family protein [Thermoanaerobaculia bacterium]